MAIAEKSKKDDARTDTGKRQGRKRSNHDTKVCLIKYHKFSMRVHVGVRVILDATIAAYSLVIKFRGQKILRSPNIISY